MTNRTNPTNPTARLLEHLDQITQHLVELGTHAETRRLGELARTIQHVAPGTAAALTDADASEISRLRAFAVATSAVLRLPSAAHQALLDELEPTPAGLAAA
jgi:hypothetical protein